MRKSKTKYDIFISYRRAGGYQTAHLLYDNLVRRGYRVSFDLETLRDGGKFNEKLYDRIERCSDVLAIMSGDSLQFRENVEDDWFRLEIAHALKCGKNIVPVFLRDFKAPAKSELPEDMRGLMDYNGVVASQEHFDSVLNQICERFAARPRRRHARIAAAAAALAAIAAAGVVAWLGRAVLFPFPFSDVDKQRFSEIQELATRQIANYCIVANASANLLDAAETVASTDLAADFQNELQRFNNTLSQVDVDSLKPSDRLLEVASKTPIDVGDVKAFWENLATDVQSAKDEASFLEHTIATRKVMAKTDLLNIVRIKRKIQRASSELYAYFVMGLFAPVAEGAIADMKRKLAPSWTCLPELSRPWLREETDIETAIEKTLVDIQNALGELSAIVGNQNMGLRRDEKELEALQNAFGGEGGAAFKAPASPEEFRRRLEQLGATPEQIEAQMAKVEEILSMKRRLQETEGEIEAAKARAREKFAPKIDDEPGILWGKVLRLLSLDLRDAALQCVDVLRRKQSPEFPFDACTAAEVFIRNRGRLPFAAGVMVTGFEPPATHHAIFKVGDIVTGMDGKAVTGFDDYRATEGCVYTVYRCKDGALKRIDLAMPSGQPRVALVNLMEPGE